MVKKRKAPQPSAKENAQVRLIASALQSAVIKPVAAIDPLRAQVDGDHYKKMGDYQPWQVMAKWLSPEELKGFMKGTVCAYLCREDDKGGRTDIEKAMHTMQIYLEVSK